MPKKVVKQETKAKNETSETEKLILQNNVELQKILTDLSFSMMKLSDRIDKLVSLFEQTVKTVSEKEMQEEMNGKRINDKLDMLVSQNKLLAQGVSMVHEKLPEQQAAPTMNQEYPAQEENIAQAGAPQGYQRSISSMPQKFNPLPKSP